MTNLHCILLISTLRVQTKPLFELAQRASYICDVLTIEMLYSELKIKLNNFISYGNFFTYKPQNSPLPNNIYTELDLKMFMFILGICFTTQCFLVTFAAA